MTPGQRVAVKSNNFFYIGNLLNSNKVLLDCLKTVAADEVYSVKYFGTNKLPNKFEDLDLVDSDLNVVFSDKNKTLFGLESIYGLMLFLNWRIFDNRLKLFPVFVKNIKGIYARYSAEYEGEDVILDTQKMYVGTELVSPISVLTAISHEMCHAANAQGIGIKKVNGTNKVVNVPGFFVDGEAAHNAKFFAFKEPLSEIGVVLSKFADFDDKEGTLYQPVSSNVKIYLLVSEKDNTTSTVYGKNIDELLKLYHKIRSQYEKLVIVETTDLNLVKLLTTDRIRFSDLDSHKLNVVIGKLG